MKSLYKKWIEIAKSILDRKYFTKITLLVIVLLLVLLIWLNRYSYSPLGWGSRVSNLTGSGCSKILVYPRCK